MSSFLFPLSGFNINTAKITSGFGARTAPTVGASTNHKGVDIAAAAGTGVLAAAGGKVIQSAFNNAKGNYIQIQHLNGDISEYEHLNSLGVKAGDTVKAGAKIGTVGSTGISTGPHLHFGVISGGNYINPLTWRGGAQMTNSNILPGAPSAGEWFKNVTTGGTSVPKAPTTETTSTTGSGGGLDLNNLGENILTFIKKYFLWIAAGLLVYAIVTK